MSLRVSREFYLNGKHYAVGREVTEEEVGDFIGHCSAPERVVPLELTKKKPEKDDEKAKKDEKKSEKDEK